MKTLDENNQEAFLRAYPGAADPVPNGIACPCCSEELMDTSADMNYLTVPPQKAIGCPKCGYAGFRFV